MRFPLQFGKKTENETLQFAEAGSNQPLIELRDIYKIYYMGDEEVHASDGISLKI